MIRSTVNASTKTIASSGMKSQSLETVVGSPDGIVASGILVYSETDVPVAYEGSPVPSNKHWDGTP